jgi:predicted DCC family thiol-disulfide oxidoreductase YuxK
MQTNPTLESLSSSTQWQIKLLYDGECPLCVREVNFLQKRDRGRGLVSFVDIAEDDYDNNHEFLVSFYNTYTMNNDKLFIKNIYVKRK